MEVVVSLWGLLANKGSRGNAGGAEVKVLEEKSMAKWQVLRRIEWQG